MQFSNNMNSCSVGIIGTSTQGLWQGFLVPLSPWPCLCLLGLCPVHHPSQHHLKGVAGNVPSLWLCSIYSIHLIHTNLGAQGLI